MNVCICYYCISTFQIRQRLFSASSIFYPNFVGDEIGSIWITLSSVSQSHFCWSHAYFVSAITWAVFNTWSPNLVQMCPRVTSRSSSKMGHVDLFLDLKTGNPKKMHVSHTLIYQPLCGIICDGPPQQMHTDNGCTFHSRRENCSQRCRSYFSKLLKTTNIPKTLSSRLGSLELQRYWF